MNSDQQPGMRSRAAKGAILTGAAQIYRTAVNFVSNIILARLLMPADFGLIAMVASCTAAVSLVQDLGLNQATIQRSQLSLKQMSALFWLSAGSSIILAFILAGFAPGVALFFGEPRLTALTVGFAGVIALGGLQSQQLALMNREFRFKEMAAVDIVSATAGAVAGLAFAWLTSSYWALFAMTLVTTLASVFSVWLLSSFRPGLPSFEGDFREIIGFGSGVSGFNIVNYFARNADNVLIGRFYGGEQLGYYDRAYRLLLFPITQILGPLGRVMLPVLARLQSDPQRYRKAYVECISMLMAATQPSIVFMVVFAGDFIRLLLGPHWVPAAPIFQWLGVCGLHQVVTSTFGWLFLSQGRGADFFKIGAFNAIMSVASFVVGLPWGGLGVAIAFTVVNYVLLLPVTWWWTGSHGLIKTSDLVSASLPHGVATVVSAVVLAAFSRELPTLGMATCFGLVAVSYGVYGFVMFLYPSKRLILSHGLRSFAEMLPSKAMR